MRKSTTIPFLKISRQFTRHYTPIPPPNNYTSCQYSLSLPILTRSFSHGSARIQSTSWMKLRELRGYSQYSSVALEQSPPPILSRKDSTPSSDHQYSRKKVLLLMSGGVDSSMCAHILKTQGYDVTGLYMHNWNHQEETQDELESKPEHQQPWQNKNNDTLYLKESSVNSSDTSSEKTGIQRTARIRPKVCTSDRDWADVQTICAQIGIPARRLDFSRQYWNQVFEVMLQGYENGRTPNPDVACNREIKFGELIEWCNKNGGLGEDRFKDVNLGGCNINDQLDANLPGWDYLATGHYAHVERDPVTGRAKLLRASDSNKDQTYYLSTLPEKVLRNVIFPLARYDKPTVKKMAVDTGLVELKNVATKKESMGVCFVGQRKRFGEFLKEYLEPKPGPVKVDTLDGRLVGKHKGLFHYTIGQASGVAHGHQKWVVLRVDIPSNTLIVVDGTQNQQLLSPGLIAESWHWISGHPPKSLMQCSSMGSESIEEEAFPFTAQIRHRQEPQQCKIEPILDPSSGSTDAISAKTFRVIFKDYQRAIAPGQQVVLYDKDECLGGAVIQSSLPSPFRLEN